MSRIEVLPDPVARRIAAGEVIERPVSVVKELAENALDAGARNVTIEITQGGRERIAVTDDGEGMASEDVPLAFRPHATSKIRSEEDLLRVATLGFRGEALPSIAAVADVELSTRRRSDAAGTRFRIRGGESLGLEEAGAAPGCRVEVRELFFNTPVRRKFLKSPAAEAGQVAQLVGRLALAYPEIGFTLLQDGRETLSLPRSDLRTRIRRVLGREIEAEMAPLATGGVVRVEGFATHPHFSLANSRSVVFFVNRRSIRDRVLQHALLNAYATLLPHGRYPAAVVLLAIAPDEVDVNVHPTKLEVRFRNSQAIHEALHRAVRAMVAPSPAARGAVSEASAGYRPLTLVPREAATSAFHTEAAREEAASTAAGLFPAAGPFAELRIVGQLFEGYIVCEADDEVVLIDQHAAHERVAFERLRVERARGRIESQALLVPQTVELAPGEVELLGEVGADLAACALEVEPFGERAVAVRTVPALFGARDVAPLLRAIAGEVAEAERSRALEERSDGFLATIACHSVVRVGQALSEAEIRGLLVAMDGVDVNTNCPHGRPVTARMSRAELERRFGR